MTRATLLLRLKYTDMDGDIIEQVIWEVPLSAHRPDGVRYRFAFIRHGERTPTVLYDNHHPKGHHKHIGRVESPVAFTGIERLLADFESDVAEQKALRRSNE